MGRYPADSLLPGEVHAAPWGSQGFPDADPRAGRETSESKALGRTLGERGGHNERPPRHREVRMKFRRVPCK